MCARAESYVSHPAKNYLDISDKIQVRNTSAPKDLDHEMMGMDLIGPTREQAFPLSRSFLNTHAGVHPGTA